MKKIKNEKNILVVDDDPKMRKVVSEFLRKNYNFQIIEAKDGLDAISKTFKYKFSAVITDLEMPEMNGLEFIGYLNTKPEFDKVPKFLLTSEIGVFYKKKAKNIGVNAHLSKPLKPRELKKVLDKVSNFV